MPRVGLVVVLALLAAPSLARASGAGGVTIVSRDLSGGHPRPAVVRAPIRFDMVGLRWHGPGSVRFRTRTERGRWSPWRAADDNPSWTGPAVALQYRVRGRAAHLRAYYLWSPVRRGELRRLSLSGSPPIVSRAAWGGNELPRRNRPLYAPSVRLVIVHHTATPNTYTQAQAAAIVRGIDVYHVRANGWNDIGYNFLIDRYGRIYEGRYGGTTKNVIGAHALGFNTGSVGIALIGNFMTARPTSAAIRSLERLIAWRLDLAHVDPASRLVYVSGGSERWRAGTKVVLRAVSGHRDTGSTSCPGDVLYPLLGQIAASAQRIGLPKLYTPAVRGRIGGPVAFSGRLSSALPWTITVAGPGGRAVARGSGVGPAIAWTWNSAGLPGGRYTWTMEAGATVLPARGVVEGSPVPPPPRPPPPPPPPPPAPLVEGLAVAPAVISPNGDGFADAGTISYTLTGRSAVTATVTDAGGMPVETLFDSQEQSARAISFAFSPVDLPDGRYQLAVSARSDDGRSGSATAAFTVDRVLSGVAAVPATVAPGGSVAATFALAGDAQVTVVILGPDGSTVATLFEGELAPGAYSYLWSTALPDGTAAPTGRYQVLVTAVDAFGAVSQSAGLDVALPP